jgi:hypothetical protein
MSNSTQRFFNSTKRALSFGGKTKTPSSVSRLGASTTSKKKKSKSNPGSWYQSEEPAAPKTMDEWWNLKRVDPI